MGELQGQKEFDIMYVHGFAYAQNENSKKIQKSGHDTCGKHEV